MTLPTAVKVCAPSRLHFGLFSFNDPSSPLQYGGVGVMINAPGVRLRAERSDQPRAAGPHADRVASFARRAAEQIGPAAGAIEWRVDAAPRQHVGLGLGTQLGMSVAAAAMTLAGGEADSAAELAQASGRGLRSAIGAHGFMSGGMLIDGGHRSTEPLGRLEHRVDLPAAWRFVLIIPPVEEGLANTAEQDAFARMPPPPDEVTRRLHSLATDELLPAAQGANFARFADTIYEYGRSAGECFAAVQGGPFAGPAIAERVALLRSLGVAGCGQSSWGPTVFAVTPDEASAGSLIDQLRDAPATSDCDLLAAAPCNTGATVTPIYSSP